MDIELRVARMGDPETLPREVCNSAFELVENLPPEEQEARYFQDRTKGLRPMGSYFSHFHVLT
jgi:hypothetical protein